VGRRAVRETAAPGRQAHRPPVADLPAAHHLAALQRSAGNQATATLLRQAAASEVWPLRIAASVLIGLGVTDMTDLTDALFAIVHPELGGGPIPKGNKELEAEWLRIRRLVARPALAGDKSASAQAPASAKPESAVDVPAARPSEPWDPAKSKPIPADQADLAAKHPELAAEFLGLKPPVRDAFDKKGGFKHYVSLRGLYAKRLGAGKSPVPRLNALEFGFTFCGDKLDGLDPRLTARLGAVEAECFALVKKMRADGVLVKFEGAFQPRATTDKASSLSDHALGLALHLNYKSNPYIGRLGKRGSQAAEIIERIVGQTGEADFWDELRLRKNESRGAHVERVYQAYASASDAVAAYFQALDAGTLSAAEQTKRKKEYEIVKKAHAGGDPKLRDPKRGFFVHTAHAAGDPMLELIKLLTLTAGLQWGGEYWTRPKDLHHFALKVKD
jgi:hypothetical protein